MSNTEGKLNPKLLAYLLSCLMAFIAGHIINYSIIFLALEWFDSHALAGLGYGLCFGPPLILGWFAGVYCDRYSPRRVILTAQNSYFVSLLLLYFALAATPNMQKLLLLVAAFFSGIGWSFVAPARFAALPFYVRPEKLTGASIALNLMVMSGFGLAPMLLKQVKFHFDWEAVFITATGLFVVSSALLLPLRFKFKSKPAGKAAQEIKSSLQFVHQSDFIKQLLLLSMITYLLMGPMQVILPTVAKELLQLNETAQGTYLSLIAFSLIVGGLSAMWLKNKGNIGFNTMLAIAIAGAGLAYVSIESSLAWSVTILVLASISGGIAISFIVAGLQAYSADEHRGRIMSFYSIISQFIPAASGVGAGALAQLFSPMIALQIVAGIIVSCALLCMLMLSSVRRLQVFEHANN